MKKKKKLDKVSKVLIFLSSVSFILVAVVVIQFLIFENSATNSLKDGTVVNGINLSGMQKNQAIDKLSKYFNDKSENLKISLKYKDKSWNFSGDDFKLSSNIHTILDAANQHKNQTSTHKLQAEKLNFMLDSGDSLSVALNYIFIGLEDKIDEIAKEVEIEAQNSTIEFKPDAKEMFTISKSKNGLALDMDELYKNLNQQFVKGNNISLNIPTKIVEPAITEEYNKSLTNKISHFTTSVGDSTGGRKANVNLALSKFNGMRIESGQEVSFNKITCPHSAQNGYKIATIIYNGQFVDGVGGGICQASTTLYNALLLAGVEIKEVNKHTLPVKYVPLALDAMVAEHISDLRFKNIYDHPIFIKTYSDEGNVYVEIFSHTLPDNTSYKTRSEKIGILPHGGDKIVPDTKGEHTNKVLFKGEYHRVSYPREGVEAKSYLQIYNNGVMVEEKLLRHEKYPPQFGVIVEGVEKAPKEIKIIDDAVTLIDQQTSIILENMHEPIPTNFCP